MKQFSFKLPESLAQEVNEALHMSRFTSRSELCRALLRRFVEETRTKRTSPL